MRKTPQFGKMLEQMLNNLLLGILRTTPEIRRAADIEAGDSSLGGNHDLALGERQPQCAHEAKALRGVNRQHLHRLGDPVTRAKHRGHDFLSRHIDRRLLPRWDRLE